MESTFKIKKTILEKQLQNLNIQDLENTLDNMNQSFAVDLLSVDKNIKLLSKKADFDFLSKVFQKINTLQSSFNSFQFLKVSNDFFFQTVHMNHLKENIQHTKLESFVEKVIDLSISHKKKHTLKELHTVISIGKSFNINEKKIVNWIGKITAYSHNTDILESNLKLPLLQKKLLKERYISLIMNVTQDTKILDKTFQLYEPSIYEIYAQHKDNQTTWNCLLPKTYYSYYSEKYLPYIDSNKLHWLENKKIGYKNHPVYFELYQLEKDFKQSQYSQSSREEFDLKISDEYYQNLIYNSLSDYHNNYRFKKEACFKKFIEIPENETKPERFIYSEEYRGFKDWISSSPIATVLNIYDSNKDFYEYCKKLKLKISLEDKLIPEQKKEKKLKI